MKITTFPTLILLLLTCIKVYSQKPVIINNEALEFELPDKENSIDFIVLGTNLESKKPIFLWCQGSLPIPLFVKDKKEIWMIGGGITNFDYKKISEKYHLIIISMPETPVVVNEDELTSSYWYAPTDKSNPTDKFSKSDYLENYVSRAEKVLKFLKKQKWVDNSSLVVAGHSQGSKVAIKLVSENKKVTRLGLFAPNPFGRIDEFIRKARKDAENNRMSWEESNEEMQKQYDFYKAANDSKSIEKDNSLIAWKSFSKPLINELLSIKIPIFVTYGTADISSDLCDIIPLYFIEKGKSNLTLKRLFGLDHNFFEVDESQKPDYNKGHWKEVMSSFLTWLNLETPANTR